MIINDNNTVGNNNHSKNNKLERIILLLLLQLEFLVQRIMQNYPYHPIFSKEKLKEIENYKSQNKVLLAYFVPLKAGVKAEELVNIENWQKKK